MSSLLDSLSLWKVFFLHKLKQALLYKSYVLLWTLSAITPLLMMFAWTSGLSNYGQGSLEVAYVSSHFAFVVLIRQLTTVWVSDDLGRQISDGDLACKMLWPRPVYLEHIFGHFAGTSMRVVPAFFIFSCILAFSSASFSIVRIEFLPFFAISMVISWVLSFTIGWIIGSLAFWMSNYKIVSSFVGSAAFALGGSIGPLEYLPSAMQKIAVWTPFPSIVSAPILMILNELSVSDVLQIMAQQLAWLAIIVLCAALCWRTGLRRYEVGGE